MFGNHLVQTPCSKQGKLDLPQDCILRDFKWLQRQRLHNLTGQTIQMFDHPFTKIFVPIFKGNFLYMTLCLLSLVKSLSTTKKKLGLSPSLLPNKYFYTLIVSVLSLLSSRLNNLSSLSIFSYEKCPNSLLNFLDISWTPSSNSPLFMWGAQNLTHKDRCISRRQRREEGLSLLISRWWSSKWSPGCWWALLQGHISGFWSACCSKGPQGHSAKLPSSQLGPSMYWCMRILYYKTFLGRIKDTGGFVKENAH